MKNILFLITLTNLLACSNAQNMDNLQNDMDKVKFIDESNQLDLVLTIKGNKLFGSHCFVVFEGKRIDCCLDDMDGNSIELEKNENGIYTGTMYSCYDEQKHNISIEVKEDEILFMCDENKHEFLEEGKSIKFTKEK